MFLFQPPSPHLQKLRKMHHKKEGNKKSAFFEKDSQKNAKLKNKIEKKNFGFLCVEMSRNLDPKAEKPVYELNFSEQKKKKFAFKNFRNKSSTANIF